MHLFVDYHPWTILLKASGQAAVLIVLVLAAQWALGLRLRPRWRYGLWLLVVVRLALPWTMPSAVSVYNLLNFSSVSEAVFNLRASHGVPDSPGPQSNTSVPAESPVQESAVSSPTEAPVFSMNLAWLPLVWAAGAFAVGLFLVIANHRFSRRITPCRPFIDARVMNLLEDCKQAMGVRVPVVLVETAAVDGPCLFGFLRPRLLLPPGFTREFSRDELRYVFLHELAHVKRHDIPLGWLMALLQILHWFNPLVWLAFSHMRADRELACDALALSHAEDQDKKPYGRTIVKLLESFGQSLRMPSLAGINEDKQQIKERIIMITKFQKTNRGTALAFSLFIGLGLLTLTDCKKGETPSTPAAKQSEEQQMVTKAEAGDKWAAYNLWDAYHRGKNGIQPDSAKAEKWLGEFVQDVWVVRFKTVKDFAPSNPGDFLARINEFAHTQSGETNIGLGSFFRTTKQGDKLVGSFLSNYPDELKARLAKVPGIEVTSVEQMTPEKFIEYEQSPQESLSTGTGADKKWDEQQEVAKAEAGDKWAAYGLWDAYSRGRHGISADPAQAQKWVQEFAQNVWVVKFKPVNGFAPANPKDFLARINSHARTYSGQTNIGVASFFRTTKQGGTLVGSFLSNYPDKLKASLARVPGLKVTSVEKITPDKFIKYEKSAQESL